MTYEMKDATAELGKRAKIGIMARKTAYLVPKMFSKLKSGFKKGINRIKNSKVAEVVTSIPGAVKTAASTVGATAYKAASAVGSGVHTAASAVGNTVKAGVENVGSYLGDRYDVAGAKEAALEAGDNYTDQKAHKIVDKVDAKMEARDNVEAAPSESKYDDSLKKYAIKSYTSEIKGLEAKLAKNNNKKSACRKLIISKVFLKKLVTNRVKRVVNDLKDVKAKLAEIRDDMKLRFDEARMEKQAERDYKQEQKQQEADQRREAAEVDEYMKKYSELEKYGKEHNITQEKISKYYSPAQEEPEMEDSYEDEESRTR